MQTDWQTIVFFFLVVYDLKKSVITQVRYSVHSDFKFVANDALFNLNYPCNYSRFNLKYLTFQDTTTRTCCVRCVKLTTQSQVATGRVRIPSPNHAFCYSLSLCLGQRSHFAWLLGLWELWVLL